MGSCSRFGDTDIDSIRKCNRCTGDLAKLLTPENFGLSTRPVNRVCFSKQQGIKVFDLILAADRKRP